MRIDIYIASYNRPEYLVHLVNSLKHQTCTRYEIGNVHLFQDGPKKERYEYDAEKISICIKLFKKAFPSGHVHAAETNIGINGNFGGLWHNMAASDSDAAIVFDDDLELSPNYLDVMAKLLEHAQGNPNVGFVSALGLLGATQENQELRQRALIPMGSVWGIHRWGWGVTREVINEFYPLVNMYLEYALRLGFTDNGDKELHEQHQEMMFTFMIKIGFFQGTLTIEIDAVYDMCALLFGRVHLMTYANFGRSIGEHGVHFNPGLFEYLGYSQAENIDNFSGNFDWYETEMMMDLLVLIRRYHSSLQANFESRYLACVTPFAPIGKSHIIKCLYENIFGWPLEKHDLLIHNILKVPSHDEFIESKVDESFGLLNSGRRKNPNYKFPYAI